LKVVYHLCDLDKVAFVLGNIRNHFEGMGGADKMTIALVVHGPALKAFHSKSANAELARRVGENVTLKDLLPGFINADRGGVVRIAELQADGYVYLKP
jgi:intracellular sulfur oxidation DsrE/DsrF family protein